MLNTLYNGRYILYIGLTIKCFGVCLLYFAVNGFLRKVKPVPAITEFPLPSSHVRGNLANLEFLKSSVEKWFSTALKNCYIGSIYRPFR